MRVISGSCLLLLFAACTGEPPPPPEMTNAERGEIQAEVLEWSDQFLEAVNRIDSEAVLALFDPADGHFVNSGSYWATPQAHRAGKQELYAGWETWQGEWETRRVDVLSPERALLVGEVVGVMKPVDGGEIDHQTFFSFLLRKEEGVWRGLFGHVSGNWTPRQ